MGKQLTRIQLRMLWIHSSEVTRLWRRLEDVQELLLTKLLRMQLMKTTRVLKHSVASKKDA